MGFSADFYMGDWGLDDDGLTVVDTSLNDEYHPGTRFVIADVLPSNENFPSSRATALLISQAPMLFYALNAIFRSARCYASRPDEWVIGKEGLDNARLVLESTQLGAR